MQHIKKVGVKTLFIFTFIIFIVSCSSKDNNTNSEDTPIEKVILLEADTSNFPNPERGLYKHWGDLAVEDYDVKNLRQEGITLLLNIYTFKNFLDKPLSQDVLDRVEQNFTALRNAGAKSVLRFRYSYEIEAGVPTDADLEQVLEHIEQLKPILIRNADVISVLEAGFIGAYGEWHTSTYYENSSGSGADYPKRKLVVDALLDALPNNRMICIRTPYHKTGILEIDYSDTLTFSEAYSKTPKARLAHHNDCFLASETDMGTYRFPPYDRAYAAHDSRYTCMGGETCAPSKYSECANALSEMEKYHWSYLNATYQPTVIDGWIINSCFDEIQKRLGYRFVVKEIKHPEKVTLSKDFTLNVSIKNEGFAAPYNPREAYILFRENDSSEVAYSHKIQSNPQYWFGGAVIDINEVINLPKTLTAESYSVILWMPDIDSSIKEKSEFAIRLANKNVWEESTGYNILFRQQIKHEEE